MIEVLLVEDDAMTGHAMACALSGEGYRLRTAGTMGEARALASEAMGAAILDLAIPGGGSGADLIGPILAANPSCRVVVCTARALDEAGRAALRALGARCVLSKPVDFAELVRCLRGDAPRGVGP